MSLISNSALREGKKNVPRSQILRESIEVVDMLMAYLRPGSLDPKDLEWLIDFLNRSKEYTDESTTDRPQ